MSQVSGRDGAESAVVAAVLALPRALERGEHGEQLHSLFAADATSTEYPNRLVPQGRTSTLDEVLAASEVGAALLESQSYDVHEIVASGEQVAFRYTWTGVIAVDRGPFAAGQQLVAHIGPFATVRDGRIATFHTYDCYEPF